MKKTILSALIALISFTGFAQGHFVVAFTGNGQDHMNLNVLTATLNGGNLAAGDEIAAFDGSNCCGKVVLTQPVIFSDPNSFVVIAASKKDDGLTNGYTVGNTILYKIWDASESKEVTVASEYFDPGTGLATTAPTYTANSSAFVKLTGTLNNPPVANAGADQTVNEGVAVTLDGSASSDADGNTLTYLWTAPAGIALNSATAANPTFTAPEVATDTQYTFSLVVNDGTVSSPASQVVITIKQVNKVPASNAGINQTVNEGAIVTLDGSASSDADGNALTYLWTAPAGITLNSATAAKPTFTAPEVATDTQYTFSLVVNDGLVSSLADQVVITIKQVNKVPASNAGINQTVNEGAIVTLDGSASSDFDGNALTYLWTAPAGIMLNSTTSDKPTFTAPQVSSDTQYTFSLVVNDGLVSSPASQVVITVKQVNSPPVANAGADQTVNEGVTVTLDGSASSDADGNALTYLWTAPLGITLSSTTSDKPTFTAPEVATDTQYTFSLVVNDGTVSSPASQVVITIKQVNKVPASNAGINQTVNEGAIVTLDGSASSDADGNALTYLWTAPAGITLNSATAAKPTFTAPEVATDTQYTFSLVVNDGLVSSLADQVVITIKQVNKVPASNAGINQTVNEGAIVTLDGSASSDFDGNALTYLWTAPAGIMLNSTTSDKPTFTAPQVSSDTQYTFSLVVNDGLVSSPASQVVITVKFVVGLNSVRDADVQIYPNPVIDQVSIKFDSEPMVGTLITIYDFSGKIILKSIAASKEMSLNLNSTPAGPYFIRIDRQTSKTYKVIKE